MTAIVSWNARIIPIVNGPDWTFIEIFSAFMAGMVVFKTLFAVIHICHMRYIYNFKILIPKIDLRKFGRKFND